MPRGGTRPGAGKKAKVTNKVYLDAYESVWGPHIEELLKQKLIDAFGYDPNIPIDPKKNPKRPPNIKERNDILDRLVGPAFANHQPNTEQNNQITFLDILIQQVSPSDEKVIEQPKTKTIAASSEQEETVIEGTGVKLIG